MVDVRQIELGASGLTAARTGSGPDLVVIHSLLADRTAFDAVLPWLAERFTVTLVNLPGFHGSRVIEPGIERYADHVTQGLREGGVREGATVLANGFGGTVALALALRHPAAFGKLLLSDAAAGFPPAGADAFRVMAEKVTAEGIGSVATISANRVFHPAYLAAHPGAVDERRSVLMAMDPAAFVAACQTLMRTNLVSELWRIQAPTLVVCGELDAATPPALCRQVAQNIPGAEYRELPGCGHCPPLEQPDAFIAAVEGFLAR
ncbi:hydrolase [Alsobacter metallidurans]|uniref:Hydrolase n=1 Tax=Alsobacter metallidurans TaxID=340221 RepID=A0A917MJ20_9HYPH|nr:alpha/beta fold hydrolase [Alsobacter metallidurans]GGH24147.1 hydrolase [Alsobacter metallidurans]